MTIIAQRRVKMMTDNPSKPSSFIANDSTDFVPPSRIYMDDILVNDPQLGTVPFWKSLIWNTANLRNAMTRADSAGLNEKTSLRDEDKPPPPVGAMPDTVRKDQEAPGSEAEEPAASEEAESTVSAICASLDRLSARIDALETAQREAARAEAARAKAQQALLDAEELFTAREAPDPNTVIH
jgi:hypothetical protein